ncbi:phosphomannomutase, putative [Theileria annulata]|uniref:Phosphomannomutase n=1 Tax=Theileria annulata TaxID=5874 RepID=Q4UHX5_THEAN|nr:phosphomannomutase, putative [Theileria annulata]CAI73314.1 phosphomannomutase, putative [Theileria annulata]|eukprot:XP_953991.1 phosphomannomutase, putative [Theileria annulata]
MEDGSTILLFDLDETLALSFKPVTDEMKRILLFCKDKGYHIGLVSGSDFKKVESQLNPEFSKSFNFIFCENGTQVYKNCQLVHSESIIKFLPDSLYKDLVNYVLVYIANLDIPKKRGCFIELRNSIINISPIGRNCSEPERHEFYNYDCVEKVRLKMCQDLNERFRDCEPKLHFSVGGKISVDVFPEGWSKTFCLKFLEDYKTIHFFGDMTDPGGNDHEIFIHPRVIGHKVLNYQDTIKQLNELFLNK